MMRPMDRFARFSWLVLAYSLAVVLWGAFVRASGSGAGCGSHWPLCNGEVVPRAASVETLIELSHRLTSGLALLLVVGLVIGAFRARPPRHPARRAALWSLAFMLTEAAVGAGLVLFELVAENESMARALFMAVHLVNTFFLIAALTLAARAASGGAPFRIRGQGAVGWWLAAAVVLSLSAGVSGAIAALGDTLFPATSLAEALRQDLSPTAHLLLRLRLLHPALAVATSLVMIALALKLPRRRPGPRVASPARLVLGLVVVQLAAGALNVLLLAPIWLQLVHLLLADLLWIAFVLLGAEALTADVADAADAADPVLSRSGLASALKR